jgi:putative ABC transport system permease protein
MDQGVQFVEEHKPMRDTDLDRIKGVKGVAWAVPLTKNLVNAKLPDGATKTIDLAGIDDATLIGAPSRILSGQLSDFKRADAIFVDYEASRTRLRVQMPDKTSRPLMVGDIIEINDKRAFVVGIIKATRNFIVQPQAYTTYTRSRSFMQQSRRKMSYVLAKVQKGANPEEVARQITETTGLKAYTRQQFCDKNLTYWMENTGIPINFGISVLLGFIVGAAIAGQTFYTFVQENIKHYAALKAMGVRNKLLSKMVMLQAAVVGIIGYGIGVGLTTLFGIAFDDTVLAFLMAPSLLLYSGFGVLCIILIAALFGIRRVINVDPSIVFRS